MNHLAANFPRPALMLIPLLALLVGCKEDMARPEVYPAAGHLTVNGQPPIGALLSLHPVDGKDFDKRGSRPWATVQADGGFALSTYGKGDGAPAGEYAVSVVWMENPDSPNPADKLAGRFANPQRSEWRVQIHEGENQLESHRIDGVRLTRGRQASASIDPPQ